MAVSDPQTTNFGLPLKVLGIFALQRTVKRGFEMIDELLGGQGTFNAENIDYTANDSNSTQATRSVAAELDALRARLATLEAGVIGSNSPLI